MAIYTIADLHLSMANPKKSMTVFGPRWDNYEERLRTQWTSIVSQGDTVVIPGDISWAMSLKEAEPDFAFLESLPGTKLIGKGNHDFWWTTVKKIEAFWAERHFTSLRILYNNAYIAEDKILCGTRGWFFDEKSQNTTMETDFEKLCNREAIRLKLSLDAAVNLRKQDGRDLPLVAFLHFPPLWNGEAADNLLQLLREYGVSDCYFGHIHGAAGSPKVQKHDGISLHLIASDHLRFCPMLLR